MSETATAVAPVGAVSSHTAVVLEEADVQSRLRLEEQRLIEDTTCFRMICPRTKVEQHKDDAKSAAEDGKVDSPKESGASAVASAGAAKSEDETKRVPFCGSRGLFRFADSIDMMLYTLGVIGAMAHGAVMPLFALIFGELIDSLQDPDPDALSRRIDQVSLWFVYIGVGSILLSFLEVGLTAIAAERQVGRIREEYMRALLRQDMSWFDSNDPGEVASRLTEDTTIVLGGMGEKFGNAIHFATSFVTGLIIGFVRGWDLALVILAFVPLLAMPMMILKTAKTLLERITTDAYARASSASNEAVGNIRTVTAFGGQLAESRRYNGNLGLAELVSIRGARVVGLAVGLFWMSIMASYAAGMAFGASKIRADRNDKLQCAQFLAITLDECYTAGTLMQTFFAVIIGAMSLGQMAPNFSSFGAAQAAAYKIFAVIDRVSPIDPTSTAGHCPATRCTGRIEFKNVTFSYPTRPERPALKNFSLVIEPGQTVALVGPSGSGKSTTVQLLMRFYDPDEGEILLDGRNIREYNIAWLREQMGLVSQEPSLFSTTVEENIALGLPSYRSTFGDGDADGLPVLNAELQARVVEAAKAASAHEFIDKLSLKYRTRVGDRGGQLSGGQKQRVAIARALIRHPQIFIGDEATSALDTESEKQVKTAIDHLLRGEGKSLTSLLIAHRLSTINNADVICVLDHGELRERGSHAELIALGGIYAALSAGQHLGAEGDEAGDVAAAAAAGAVDLSAMALAPTTAPTGRSISADHAGSPALRAVAGGADFDAIPAMRSRGASVTSSQGERSRAPSHHSSDGASKGAAAAAAAAAKKASEAADDVLAVARTASIRTGAAAISSLDRAVLALIDISTSEPDAETGIAPTLSTTTSMSESEPAKPLARNAPEVLLLVSALLEMADNEKRNFIKWWLGDSVGSVIPEGDRVAAHFAALTPRPKLLPPTLVMKRKARDEKANIWDIKPEVDPKKAELYLTPARTRNKMLGNVLSASAPLIPLSRVFQYQTPEIPQVIIAIFFAAVAGCVFPIYALILSDMLTVLYKFGDDFEEGVLAYCLAFLGIGLVAAIAEFSKISLFEFLGAKLTTRMRRDTYAALLRQEVGYFDYEHNSTGQVVGRLAGDAALVRATTGEKLGLMVQNLVSLLAGLIIAFTASWQLSLIVLAVVPLFVLSGIVHMKALTGLSNTAKEALERSAQIATEAMTGIRTVSALGLQQHVQASFSRSLEAPRRNSFITGALGGASFGLSQAVLFCAGYALIFWSGSRFIANGTIDFNDVTRVFFALTFASTGAGNANAMATDQAKAESAKRSIFALLDRISKIDPLAVGGLKPEGGIKGRIEFKNVTFSYPARPDALALKNFSLVIEPGQTVALVGPSGSGKSTIVQLLMRFYDPDEGEILLDGRNIREYNIAWLREQMGLVQQEPVLFADTVQYNIAYGRGMDLRAKPLPDQGLLTSRDSADMPDVIEAAKMASAHEFITDAPLGYATFAGAVGLSQLSGGQKQRVAIARAVIRNPKLFFGDEATSALDTKSEAEVQAALDRMLAETRAKGLERTSVFVAHRLSTIRDADIICVLEAGGKVEQGKHDELLATPGSLYARLARAQDIATEATSVAEPASAAAAAGVASE